jgi:hypothetical protein
MEEVSAMLRAEVEAGKRRRRSNSLTSPALVGGSPTSPAAGVSRNFQFADATAASGSSGFVEYSAEDFDGVPAQEEEEEEKGRKGGGEGPDPMLIGTGLWDWGGVDVGAQRERRAQEGVLNNHNFTSLLQETCGGGGGGGLGVTAPPTSPTSPHSPVFGKVNVDFPSDSVFPQSPSSMDVEIDNGHSNSDFASQLCTDEDTLGGGRVSSAAIDQWQMCAICLEELLATQLLTHQACSGVFCHTCLEVRNLAVKCLHMLRWGSLCWGCIVFLAKLCFYLFVCLCLLLVFLEDRTHCFRLSVCPCLFVISFLRRENPYLKFLL